MKFKKNLVLSDDAFKSENIPKLIELLGEIVDLNSSHIPYQRMLVRYFEAPAIRPVKVMDDHDIKPKNKATWVIYQLVPFVGKEDLYTYVRHADEEGNITKVDRRLKDKAPFGVYKLWKTAVDRGYRELLP